MKSMMIRLALMASVVGLLFAISPARGPQSGLMASVHAQEGCSVATLQGSYGFFRTGAVPAGPLAAVGIATFNGNGTTTFGQTIRKNGVTTSDLFTDPQQAGLYEVNADCTGKFLTTDGSVFAHIVIVAGGRELFGISLSDENTVTGVWKKMSGGQQ